MITQAVITAGGKGERLRPLTDTVPKVMIPLAGKPLLEHHIEQFKTCGVTEFFFTLQYMPEKITEYFADGSKWGVKIFYHIEKEPLEDMGGIRAFEDKLHNEFFFTWGDMYSEMDYSRLGAYFFGRSGAIGVERVAQVPYKSEADFVGLDEKKKLIAVYPKGGADPTGPVYRLRGSAVFSKRILKYFPPAGPFNKKDLLVGLLNVGEEFYGYECDEYSKGIDTMEKYNEVQRHISP
jgi:mannose-1-phosphate guanylyltransferase/phosphomannomutase